MKKHPYVRIQDSHEAFMHLLDVHEEPDKLAYGKEPMSRLRKHLPFRTDELHRELHKLKPKK